jgi:hypothetical protein
LSPCKSIKDYFSIVEIICLVDLHFLLHSMPIDRGGCPGRDRMVVGFPTACTIRAYHL